MNQRPVPGAEQPRAEPEIIPPGDADVRGRWRRPQTSFDGRSTQRIYVARLGPFGFAVLVLALAVLAALVLLLMLGAFVVLIPVAGVLLVAAVVISLLRGSRRRPR
jgi:hypothetical protein